MGCCVLTKGNYIFFIFFITIYLLENVIIKSQERVVHEDNIKAESKQIENEPINNKTNEIKTNENKTNENKAQESKPKENNPIENNNENNELKDNIDNHKNSIASSELSDA